jgi:membrane protein involved in colicin uptake
MMRAPFHWRRRYPDRPALGRKRRNEEKVSEKKARKKEEKKALKARHETLKHAARRAARSASRHFADVLGAGGGGSARAKHSKRSSVEHTGAQAGTCFKSSSIFSAVQKFVCSYFFW